MAAADKAENEFRAFDSIGTATRGNVGIPIASAAGVIAEPTAYLTVVSGALAITLIPLPYPEFSGTIAFRPTGAFTGATGGVATAVNKPIGLAFTAVVGKILLLTYDPTSGLWYPNYVA